MKEFCEALLDHARSLGAQYADVRVVRRRTQSIETKNGKVEALTE